MKTEEEIEQLAEKFFEEIPNTEIWGGEQFGYIMGYNQCLKDIRKDWQNYTISEKSDFIEFLNKQD